jgi:hypothetical protein
MKCEIIIFHQSNRCQEKILDQNMAKGEGLGRSLRRKWTGNIRISGGCDEKKRGS